MKILTHLTAEAVALAGGNLCASGHDWDTEGGRACTREDCTASQPVFVCIRCGEYDYGEPGGPGHEACSGPYPCSTRPWRRRFGFVC